MHKKHFCQFRSYMYHCLPVGAPIAKVPHPPSHSPRVNFKTFLVYSVFNVIIYAIPASWLFSDDGWLKQLGGIDYGCGVFNEHYPIFISSNQSQCQPEQ